MFKNELQHLEKLQKLDLLDGLCAQVNELQNEVKELRASLEFSQATLEESNKEVTTLKTTVATLIVREESLTKENKKLQEAMLDIQCRSMRDNIVVSGIPERRDEKNDESERILKTFLVEKLQIPRDRAQNIAFARVHRLGKLSEDPESGPRPLIAKLEVYKDKEMIMGKGKLLKGTNIGLNQQFPHEIMQRRKKLVPLLKAARDKKETVKLVVDKL